MKLKVNCVIPNEYESRLTIQGLLDYKLLKQSLGLLYLLMECSLKEIFKEQVRIAPYKMWGSIEWDTLKISRKL